jgi:class 3 adenylate cyclase
MEHAAGPGQIVVSPSTRAALPPQAVDESGGPGLLLRWRQPKAAPLAPVPLRPVPKEVVARYLPPALRTHLVERSREPEHRAATIAFLRFSGVDALMAARGPDAVAEALDEVITAVQDAATADEVTFLSTDIDEDGGKVVLATGLPSTGADDEGRMVRCLRRIADRGLSLPIQMGSTGPRLRR